MFSLLLLFIKKFEDFELHASKITPCIINCFSHNLNSLNINFEAILSLYTTFVLQPLLSVHVQKCVALMVIVQCFCAVHCFRTRVSLRQEE